MKKLKNIKLLSICIAILLVVAITTVTVAIKLSKHEEPIETVAEENLNNEQEENGKSEESESATEDNNNEESAKQEQEGVEQNDDTTTQVSNPSNNQEAQIKAPVQKVATTTTAATTSQVTTKQVSSSQSQQAPSTAANPLTQTQTQTQTTNSNQERFVRNDAIINKIKNIINSNVSDTMKKYGYTVVVDSSIRNEIHGFTFTESRILSSIKFMFGTIKIYAEDYYVGNEFRWTNAYIL